MEFQIYTQDDKESFINVYKELKLPIKVLVENIYKQRTIPQNKYYHKIKKDLADFLGMRPDEMHDYLLKKFALVEEKVIDGEVKHLVESTAYMTTERIEKFLEDVRRWAMMEHNYYIPMPNELINDYDELKLKLI